MIGATSGAGKTVLATQIATHCVSMGRNVLFITTEQSPSELVCRNLSQACCLDFKHFVESGTERIPHDVLSVDPYKPKFEAFVGRAKNQLKFLDWSVKMDYSALSNLEAYIKKCSRDGWLPDTVILDWIGGGIDKSSIDDSYKLSMLMARTAEFLKYLSKKYYFHGFFTVQLDKTKAANKRVLDMSSVQNSKQMADSCSNVILITAIRRDTGKRDDIDADDTFDDTQYLCVDKARKGPPKRIRVERQFQYQRFVETNRRTPSTLPGGSI
jgi:hypothetical protein